MLSISEIYLLPAGKGLPKSALDLARAQLKSELGKEGVKTALWNVINKVPIAVHPSVDSSAEAAVNRAVGEILGALDRDEELARSMYTAG